KMLDSDTNLTHALNYGRPPLLVAAWDGHVEIVERLLKCGADVNGPDANNMGTTPLQLAVRLNRPNVCKVLLAAGADPNLQHPFDGSALHQAFEWHRTEMAEWLLDYGANPFLEKRNPYHKATPVEMAITHSDGKLVSRMLKERQKRLEAPKPSTKQSPASRRDEPKETVAAFLTAHGGSLLSAAAQRGELEAVQALVKAGVTVGGSGGQRGSLLQAVALAEATAS